MKIKFVVESIKKIESDGSLSVQNLMNMLQNGVQQVTGTKTGDCYEFRLLYPYYQNDKVSQMIKEFKDTFIVNSKQYQFDEKTGVLLFNTIPSEEKEKPLKKLMSEILDKDDVFAILHIKHPDEFVAKLAGMKIKYFDKEEFINFNELFRNEMTELYDE